MCIRMTIYPRKLTNCRFPATIAIQNYAYFCQHCLYVLSKNLLLRALAPLACLGYPH